MSGARDPADDMVAWLVELFDELALQYRRSGAPSGAVDAEQLARLRAQLDEQIRSQWGGQDVYIHRAAWNDRIERDNAIRADRANKVSLRDIALKYGVSRTQVWRICGEAEQ